MKILFLGDVFGRPGREAVKQTLPQWREQHDPDLVVANAENAAHGAGVTAANLDELQAAGVEAFTLGDHFLDKDFKPLADYPVVRPANLPGNQPGVGSRIVETALGKRVLLVSLLGHAFLSRPVSNYFQASDQLLEEFADQDIDAILIDFHSEATSEIAALGYHLDGGISAIIGTHTHVPTADTRLLPKGTAFQSDVGFCGPLNSVIGLKQSVAERWLRNELGEDVAKPSGGGPAEEPPYVCDAVLIDVASRHRSRSIKRLTTRPGTFSG